MNTQPIQRNRSQSPMQQIENFQRFKHLTIVKIILGKIKEKYFNRDIDLDSWLFI